MYVITSTVSPGGGPAVVCEVSGTTVATPTGCRTFARIYVITSTVSPGGGPAVVCEVSGTTVATPTGCRTIAPSSVCTVAPLTTLPTLSAPLSGSERNTPPWSSVQLPPYLQHSNGQTPRMM